MRWPLRYQIMLPMAATMLLTVVVVGGAGAVLAVHGAKTRIDSQISQVARILQESNFPLTDAVLRQMRALSGAELVLVDDAGQVLASSGGPHEFRIPKNNPQSAARLSSPKTIRNPQSDREETFSLDDRLRIGDQGFFHTAFKLSGRRGGRDRGTLHILYPEAEYRRAWQRAVVPLLGFVIVALPVVLLLAAVTAAKIAGRMSRLQRQVDRIAEGNFEQLAIADRDDEIRALGRAVNRMAAMLTHYEEEVRRTERMRTLAHLGGGIAHQLRNSATGCSIALDLHAAECPAGEDCESLDVAKRQLRLMEDYLQRFLQLGKPSEGVANEVVDLAALIEDLMPLVEPAARHAGVDLHCLIGTAASTLVGDAQRLRQLVINLLVNAVEAAAQGKARNGAPAEVVVELAERPPDRIILTISDTGPGPVESVRAKLFEPFVTEKPDGVGLGLSVAREVAQEHGGRIEWLRVGDKTRFTVELPCHVDAELVAEVTSP